jgi:hypothetical protein
VSDILNKKVLAIALAFVWIVSCGAVSATTATFGGFQKDKSIGTAGLQKWTVNGKLENGLCESAFLWIQPKNNPIGSKHPVTLGTPKTTLSNEIKLLIVENYLNVKSPNSGKNLQYAVWFFTNKISSPNSCVTSMINKVKGCHITIPDLYNQLISSKTTHSTSSANTVTLNSSSNSSTTNLINSATSTPTITLISTSNCSNIKLLNTTTTKPISTISYLYNCTTSIIQCGGSCVGCCGKISNCCDNTKYLITTTVMYYKNVTASTTTSLYENTTNQINTWNNQSTTTNTYLNTTTNNYNWLNTTKNTLNTTIVDKYNVWNFSSINQPGSQKIILFTVTPKTVKYKQSKSTTTSNTFNTTNQCSNTYQTTTANNNQYNTYNTICNTYTTTKQNICTTYFTKTIVTKTKICEPKQPCKPPCNPCKGTCKC